MRAKAKKARPVAVRRHIDRIAAMPCLVCGARPVHVHHVTSDGLARTSRSDWIVAPLCPCHHLHDAGPDAIHRIGPARFNQILGFSLLEWATAEAEKSKRGES